MNDTLNCIIKRFKILIDNKIYYQSLLSSTTFIEILYIIVRLGGKDVK